jgi:hypothetical protein
MPAEIPEHDIEALRLPRNWHSYVRSAVLNVVGIVRVAMLVGREALIENGAAKDARIHQLESEVAMLREELRIVSARVHRVSEFIVEKGVDTLSITFACPHDSRRSISLTMRRSRFITRPRAA